MKKFNEFIINENHTEYFKYPNIPHEKIEKSKQWIIDNPHIARRKPEESDHFEIEVFSHGDFQKQADELYKALKDIGYLDNHPLFKIKIEPM